MVDLDICAWKNYSPLLLRTTYLACCDCANISDSPGTDCAVSLALHQTKKFIVWDSLQLWIPTPIPRQGHKIFRERKNPRSLPRYHILGFSPKTLLCITKWKWLLYLYFSKTFNKKFPIKKRIPYFHIWDSFFFFLFSSILLLFIF